MFRHLPGGVCHRIVSPSVPLLSQTLSPIGRFAKAAQPGHLFGQRCSTAHPRSLSSAPALGERRHRSLAPTSKWGLSPLSKSSISSLLGSLPQLAPEEVHHA